MDILDSLQVTLPQPRRGSGPPIDASLVSGVLAAVAERLAFVPGASSAPPEVRQRILRAACRRLLTQGALEEALFLNAQAVFDEHAADFELHLIRMLDDSRRLADAVRRLGNSMPRAWATHISLLELRLKLARGRQRDRNSPVHRSLMLRPVHHRTFGPLHATIREQLEGLPAERFTTPRVERLVGALIALRQIDAAEQGDFRRRFLWGRAAKLFLDYLVRITAELAKRPENYVATDVVLTERLQGLARQVDEVLLINGLPLLESAVQQGRNVVVAQAHAGVNLFWNGLLRSLAIKSTTFAANPRARGRNDRMQMVSTFGGGAQLGFLKIAKAIRQGQHLIRLFPDGSAGGDRVHGTVLGVPASIGAGAARLAWMAGAATFFLGSRWLDDGRLELYVMPGPIADPTIGQEAFEKAFAAFYFERLNEIANGAPEDMGGSGGAWVTLTREGAAAIGEVA